MTWRLLVESGALLLIALPLALLITLLFGSVLRGPGRVLLAGAIGVLLAGLTVAIIIVADGILSGRYFALSTFGIPLMGAIGCGLFGAVLGILIIDRRHNRQRTMGDG
jgi:hypothetical protein